jgi:serine/threonine protein kinase
MFKLEEGTLVGGKFRIVGPLGSGGMSTVYVAEQLSVGRRVALKVMRAAENDSDEEVETFERRFFLEASLCAKLSHPNIVTVFDYGEIGKDPRTGRMAYFLAMELIEGDTLEFVIERRGGLDIAEAIAVFTDIAKGLKQAHSRGLIHRDLKPANVMLSAHEDGVTAKILDFGLVRGVEASSHPRATRDTSAVSGTPYYMSPEQMFAQPLTHASDLFSFGVALYEALTGKLPFPGNTMVEIAIAHRAGPPKPMRHPRGSIPEALEALTLRLLSLSASDRPESAEHVLQELKLLEAGAERAPVVAMLTQVQTQATYRVVRKLEQRTNSIVYEGRHARLGRRVSIHVFPPGNAEGMAAELASLSTLRHTVVAETKAEFLVTEELRGRSLRTVLREGAMDDVRALQLTLQLLEAVHEMHTMGFSHGSLDQDSVYVLGTAPNELVRIDDLADRSAGVRVPETSQAAREQGDCLSVLALFSRMRTGKDGVMTSTTLSRRVDDILRPNGERTSVVPDAQTLRNAIREALQGPQTSAAAARSSARPVVWVLNEDPAIDRLALVALAHAVKDVAELRILDHAERTWLAANADDDMMPSVVLFGDLHIVLEEALLARIGEGSSTQRVLISKGLNPELLQRSINFCGVDRHICLPVSLEDLRKAVLAAVGRAAELSSRALRMSTGTRNAARTVSAAAQ